MLRHPYAPRLKRRYLHQLLAYARPLARERARLLDLRSGPVAGDVADLLEHAFDHIFFWRERMRHAGLARADLARPDALAALPPLSRADVQAHFEDMLDRTAPRAVQRDYYRGRTSGSTGEPLTYIADGFSYHWFWAFVDFALAYAAPGAPSPRPLSTGAVLLCALGHSPAYRAFLPLFHATFFEKLHVREPGFAARIERLRPAVVTGDPDSLAPILETGARPRLVLSSAFALPPALKTALEAHLRCPVVEYYSAAETGMLAIACRAGRGLHILTPAAIVESVALEGAPEAGSELLATNLRNRRFPLIRYRIGDLGRLAADPPETRCACGLHAPRIVALEGRTATLFRTASGSRFDPSALGPVLARAPLLEFRVIELAPGAYRFVYRAGRDLAAAEAEAIGERLSRMHGGPVDLALERAASPLRTPGEKPRPFVPAAEEAA